MKTCFVCNQTKELDEGFYKHSKMADGHLGKCKVCCKKQNAERFFKKSTDLEWMEAELLRHRIKSQKARAEKRGPSYPAAKKSWVKRNPEKRKAHQIVYSAIKSGILVPEICKYCDLPGQAHHEDYSKPLEVWWLCPKHHSERHVELNRVRRENRLRGICPETV